MVTSLVALRLGGVPRRARRRRPRRRRLRQGALGPRLLVLRPCLGRRRRLRRARRPPLGVVLVAGQGLERAPLCLALPGKGAWAKATDRGCSGESIFEDFLFFK